MPTFKAGELDQRITFRREVRQDDGVGGSVLSWTDIATVWAKVRPMTGREREHSDRLNAQASYFFVIRYRADITEKDIAIWNDAEFKIRFVKDAARTRFLTIEAERGTAV